MKLTLEDFTTKSTKLAQTLFDASQSVESTKCLELTLEVMRALDLYNYHKQRLEDNLAELNAWLPE